MKPKIDIIGDGNVGSALARGLERAGYEGSYCRERSIPRHGVTETGVFADAVIPALPYGAVDDAVGELGDST